ncbi:MAG: hypothetical protein ACRD2A_03705 [Vicinamibacterales bacterium]
MAYDDVPYFRLRWRGGVALYQRDASTGWYESTSDGRRSRLGAITPGFGSWVTVLDRLYDSIDAGQAA